MVQLVTVRRTTDDLFDAYASPEYDDQAVLIKNGSVVSLPHEYSYRGYPAKRALFAMRKHGG